MAKIYYSINGSLLGGGPSVHVARMIMSLKQRGHKIVADPKIADVAVCIINIEKLPRKVGPKTKTILRIDGIYNKLYNEKFNRAVKPDMTALHEDLKNGIPKIHHIVYQSQWSKDRIDDEIIKRNNNYSIIHNGVDINLFKPNDKLYKKDKHIKLMHTGFMRDDYLMRTLIGVFKELYNKIPVKLLLRGKMDGACRKIYEANKCQNIEWIGPVANNKLPPLYAQGDIYLDVRQGSSCNNTVAEAQACGLAVITPSWCGSCEMIKDQETGLVVEGGKWDYDQQYVKNLADAVEKIIPDLDEYKKRSRQHAIKELSIEKMVDKYLKVFGL